MRIIWRQWAESLNDLHALVYETVKGVNPDAHVGRHVDHQQSSYALPFRAAAEYGEMTDSNDFIKLILYHDIAGPRVMGKLDNLRDHVLKELTAKQGLDLYYSVFGHDPTIEAGVDELREAGLSPQYVYRETKRAVEGVDGGAAIYAGIGLDIPKGGGWAPTNGRAIRMTCIWRRGRRSRPGVEVSWPHENTKKSRSAACGRWARQSMKFRAAI